MTLATVPDLELYLHTQGTLAQGAPIDEGLLGKLLEAASDRFVEQRPERTLAPDPPSAEDDAVERRFPLSRTVQIPDLREVESVSIVGAGDPRLLEATDYVLRRRRNNPALWIRLKWQPLEPDAELVIVGRWGPEAVAPSVQEAVLVWAARVFHQRQARYADSQSTPDGGVLGYFRNLPPDVKVVLDSLQIPGA